MLNSFLDSLSLFAASTCKCVETSFFGKVCSTGEGTEIYAVLSIVVQILSAGIGVLATVGIVYFGVQYLTSGDDPSKVKKAKSRLFAIIIGLAVYAVAYSALYFLLPNFNPEKLDASFETCVETTPTPTPDTPTPDTPDTPTPDTPDPGDSDSGERSPYCGPEAPGPLGKLSAVINKSEENGSINTGKSSNCCKKSATYTTKKYTTRSGRVYYVFKQCNCSWGCKLAGSDTMCKRGCQRTAEAAVANSFGADITPIYFSGKGGFSYNKLKDAIAGLPVKYKTIEKDFANEIWNALQKGGAAVIHVKGGVFTNSQHKMPIVDYKIENGVKKVFIADTTTKTANNGWKKLDDIIKKGNIKKADIFVPTEELNCLATGSSTPSGSSSSTEPAKVEKGNICGPEGPSAARTYDDPTDIDKNVDGKNTKKFTTTRNRVYYIFRQDDSVWANAPVGNKTFKADGGPRTLIATIMRSFGAKLTPDYFSDDNGVTSKQQAIDRANELINNKELDLPLNTIQKITSDYEENIKSTLNSGGAILLQVQNGAFGSKSMHVAIIDGRINYGEDEVFLIDALGNKNASKDSEIKINDWTDLKNLVEKGGIKEAYLFTPNARTNCPASN